MKCPPWSYTHIDIFDICPQQYFHKCIAKDLPFVETDAMRNGKVVHAALENCVARGTALPPEFAQWGGFASSIVNMASAVRGEIRTEMKVGVDHELRPVDFFDRSVWGRGAFDVCVVAPAVRPRFCFIGDWKTGKPREKDLQLKIFSFFAFAKYPTIEKTVCTNIWLKTNTLGHKYEFHKEALPVITSEILRKVETLEQACEKEDFPKKQSPLCGWCDVMDCPFNTKKG